MCLASFRKNWNTELGWVTQGIYRSAFMNKFSILTWGFEAVIHSLLIYFLIYFTLRDGDQTLSLRTTAYTAILIITCFKAAFEAHYLTLWAKICIFSSIPLWMLYCCLSNYAFVQSGLQNLFSNEIGALSHATANIEFWSCLAIICVICMCPDIFIRGAKFLLSKKPILPEEENGSEMLSRPDLREIARTLPRNKSRADLEDLEHGFAFSETSSVNICQSDCVRAYSKSLSKPRKKRPSVIRNRRTKSIV